MTPSRLHSARRNRRWQVVTIVGTLFITAAWSLTIVRYCYLVIPKFNGSVSIGFGTSSVEFFKHDASAGYLRTSVQAGHDRHVSPLRGLQIFPLPAAPSDSRTQGIVIPIWLVLVAFLTFQYLLLPKSLPVGEEK